MWIIFRIVARITPKSNRNLCIAFAYIGLYKENSPRTRLDRSVCFSEVIDWLTNLAHPIQLKTCWQYAPYRCFVTLRAKLSGAVYCNRSCLWVCLCVFMFVWVCYHNNSKLRASIFTKLSLLVKVVTISSWLNFGLSAPPGRGSMVGQKKLAPPYYSQHSVFASLWVLFSFCL